MSDRAFWCAVFLRAIKRGYNATQSIDEANRALVGLRQQFPHEPQPREGTL